MDPSVLDDVADGVVVVDAGDRVRSLNPAAERLLSRSAARAGGAALADLSPALASLAARAREANAAAHADDIVLGTTSVDATAAPREGREVVLTLRDRTVARSLEEDARHVETLASLATVAAGIAHEVKNPLGGIRGAAQLLSREATAEQREYLDVIVREVDRIAALVDRLRDLSAEREAPERTAVDVNRVLHELALLEGASGEVRLDLDLDPSLPSVQGDAGALKRLFLNLVRNAAEAPAKHIKITTRVETGRRFRDRLGKVHALVNVTVSDDGPGVPREARARIFEPFFTTKPKGTGLGLPSAQRIAHDHDGTIAVDDAPGGGARFVVTLPAVHG